MTIKLTIMPAGDFPADKHPEVEATLARLVALRPDGFAVQATMRNSVEPDWFLTDTPWDWYERVAHVGFLALLRKTQIEEAGGAVERLVTDFEVRGSSWPFEHYRRRVAAIRRVSEAVRAATGLYPCGHYGLNHDDTWRWSARAIAHAIDSMPEWTAWCASAYFRRGVETDTRWEQMAAKARRMAFVPYIAGIDAEIQDSSGRHAIVPPARIAEQLARFADAGAAEAILWLDLHDPRCVEIAAGVLAEVRGAGGGGGGGGSTIGGGGGGGAALTAEGA